MPREIYCAECGTELTLQHKALQKQKKVIILLAPHTCPEETPDYPFKDINDELIPKPNPTKPKGNLDDIFDNFKFVQKTNDLESAEPPVTNPLLTSEPGDKRPKEDLINTGVPSGITNQIKSMPGKG